MKIIEKLLKFISNRLDDLGSIALLIILLTTTADAIMNNVFGSPFAGGTEIVSSIMPICVFSFLLSTTIKKRHIWIGLLVEKLSFKLQLLARVIVLSILIFLFGLLSYLSLPVVFYSCEIGECTGGTLPVPIWPAKVVILISVILVTVQYVIELINLFINIKKSPNIDY